MPKQIFINLALKDVQKSMDFYPTLGFTNNPQFSADAGKCMVWSESIYLMILSHEKFSSFATKPIADTKSALTYKHKEVNEIKKNRFKTLFST